MSKTGENMKLVVNLMKSTQGNPLLRYVLCVGLCSVALTITVWAEDCSTVASQGQSCKAKANPGDGSCSGACNTSCGNAKRYEYRNCFTCQTEEGKSCNSLNHPDQCDNQCQMHYATGTCECRNGCTIT